MFLQHFEYIKGNTVVTFDIQKFWCVVITPLFF